MGREKRWSVLLLALVLFAFFGGETAWAAETPVVRAQAAVLINADTGQVLFEKNARRRMEPASLTKIMTCLLAMEEAAPEEPVTVTAEAVQLMQDAAAIGLLEGETLTVAQLLYATMLPSANDAAAAIGIHLEGSTAALAEAMNRRAGELGLTGTHFSNAHGLPAADHYSTAWDLAQITRAALDYPEFLSYAGRSSYTIPASPTNRAYSFGHLNHALTLGSGSFDRRAIAGKTGWTRSAGSCLMTVAEQNGVRLIAVILKEDSQASGGNIYRDTKAVREGLAAQKTPKARAAYRQEHEADLLRSEAAVRFFKANGITKLPTVKELTAEIEALMSEKNAGYNEYQECKREADELLTVKRNIDQVLHGAPSQRRDEHDR